MNKQERHNQILLRVEHDTPGDLLSTRTLAREFNVSTITMRRDLQELAAAGLIQRRHGGVIKPRNQSGDLRNVGILLVSYQGKFSNPFYNELLEGADSALEKLGYHPAFVKTFVDVATPDQVEELSRVHAIEGLLIIGGLDQEQLRYWQDVTSNIVATPAVVSSEIDTILIDGYHGMRTMVGHLARNGHRRVGFIIGHEPAQQVDSRLPGYLAGVAEYGLDDDPQLRFEAPHALQRSPYTIGQAGAGALMSLARPPDAIMCSSDLIALSVLQWLQSHGRRVPEEVAVTGFDDIFDARIAYPPLTTVHVHKHLLGRLAAEQLHRRIENPHDPPLKIYTPTALIIRQSCCPAG